MWIRIDGSVFLYDWFESIIWNITRYSPGGPATASLGLITGVLGFGDDGTALMLAIFALQDSFGTACNVTGDGALTLFLTGYAEKHGIEKQNISVEL